MTPAPQLPPQALSVGLAVDVAAFAIEQGQLQVLLIERAALPHASHWALPGGLLKEGELLHQAALRALRTETSVLLEPKHLEQFYTFDAPERDPRGRIVSVAHLAVLGETSEVLAGGHTVRADWHPAWQPPPLAFDHQAILDSALARLRLRLEYAHLAMAFLPDTFTLPELQTVYEAVENRKLDKRNFRKRILAQGNLQPVGERRSGVGRPAQLFRRAKNVKVAAL